ncbi:MAG: hypothetical protein ACPG8W_25710 [Candidatus Promineifilaceae bacterium]
MKFPTILQTQFTKKRIKIGLVFILISYIFLFITSYTYYTSVGLDIGRTNATETAVRIRWPGNGSFWIGWSQYPNGKTSFYIDPAAAILYPPQAKPITQAQKIGFWYVNEPENGRQRHFVGIPSWLPLLFGVFIFRKTTRGSQQTHVS